MVAAKFNKITAFPVSILLVCLLGLSRAQIHGSASSNPRGGADVTLSASHPIGDNFRAGAFAAGSTNGGPVTRGGFLEAAKNGHSLTLQKSYTDKFGSTLSESARVNLMNNDRHNLDAFVFHSRTKHDTSSKIDRVGGGLDYSNANGLGATLSASRIPKIDLNSVDLTGRYNVWKSPNGQSSFDVTGGATRNFGAGAAGRRFDKHVGAVFSTRF